MVQVQNLMTYTELPQNLSTFGSPHALVNFKILSQPLIVRMG